jgi:hypothetical protein
MAFNAERVHKFLTFISKDTIGDIGAEYVNYNDVLQLFLKKDELIIKYYTHFIEVVVMPKPYKFPSVDMLLQYIDDANNRDYIKHSHQTPEFFFVFCLWAIIWH